MAYEATNVNGIYPYLIMFVGTWEIWHPSTFTCPCVLCLCGVEKN